ncbi:MAG: branched-chain amino acid ABC transporter permease [Chloroflexi bacterium]|nr:MAG: branched-chain amino acid ABC transporter permease [Chloroflexota bacterium]
MDFVTFLQQSTNAVSLGALYALFALGYSLVFSILGVLNLAHSAVFMWGAFFGLIALDQWHLPPWLAFIFASCAAGLVSVSLEYVAFRPLRKRNAARIAQLISSIGAALLLVNIAQLLYNQIYNASDAYYPRNIQLLPFIPSETVVVGSVSIAPIRLVILVIALVMMLVLQYLVTSTRTGQQMRAVAFNQRTAALLSINVNQIYVFTFLIAGMLAGAAGMLYGMAFLNVSPFVGGNVSLIGLTAIVLGGMGSIQGAVLGSFIVAGLQIASTAAGGSSYRDAIVFFLLFVVLIIRPQGILGQPEQTRA